MSAIPSPSTNDTAPDAAAKPELKPDLKDVSSLLASRICHDLISPIGAISNGMELLVMSGLQPSPELALIEESIANANARVRLFRLAFGGASHGQAMSRNDVMKLVSDCYSGGRIAVHWEPPGEMSRVEAKLVLLSIMCMETTLPTGGRINIMSDRGQWQMQAYGEKIRFQPAAWAFLSGAATGDLEASQVQFILLQEALSKLGSTPQIGHSDSAVSLRYDL